MTFADAKKAGLCYQCRCRPPRQGKTRCEQCSATAKRRWKLKAAVLTFVQSNRAKAAKWQAANPEKRRGHRRKYRESIRDAVFDHYGRTCACCGEDEIRFLTIDHKNGGGRKHRAEVGRGADFHRWLRDNGFPPEFQTLCYNCNCAKGFFGKCPHEEARRVSNG
jgi:hypothetical protein